jgi:hypothetical protein
MYFSYFSTNELNKVFLPQFTYLILIFLRRKMKVLLSYLVQTPKTCAWKLKGTHLEIYRIRQLLHLIGNMRYCLHIKLRFITLDRKETHAFIKCALLHQLSLLLD